jgi:hypothetical protein
MKEVSLQEAIELCREKGGVFYSSPSHKWIVSRGGNVVSQKDASMDFTLYAEHFEQTWIYEPPKQSAFQKWESELYPTNETSWSRSRKEGWNAAIDEVLKLKAPAGYWHETDSKIKALKEE